MPKTRPDTCDLAVVGAGVAGLTAALVAADAGAEVVVVAKAPVRGTASYLAQGGVAAAVGAGDDPEQHAEDTLRAGRGLCRPSVARVLGERAAEHPRIRIADGERVLDLWTYEGRCVGAFTTSGAISARAVLLATGGYAALWERTTNPAYAVGDGVAMAYRAGSAVADLEFVQFHPTA